MGYRISDFAIPQWSRAGIGDLSVVFFQEDLSKDELKVHGLRLGVHT